MTASLLELMIPCMYAFNLSKEVLSVYARDFMLSIKHHDTGIMKTHDGFNRVQGSTRDTKFSIVKYVSAAFCYKEFIKRLSVFPGITF